MKIYKKIIPSQYVLSIFDIDYDKLLKQGIKALFFDLDNTIIPYDINVIGTKEQELLEKLSENFKVLVISNSRKKRVKTATSNLKNIGYVKFAKKPLKFGFKKGIKLLNVKKDQVCVIGDQLMTDILGANRTKIKETILVKPVKQRTDHMLTRNNRKLENIFIRKVAKKYPEKYNEVLKSYAESK
jgi:uncharacterized protein